MTLTLMTLLMRVEQIILLYSVDNQYVIMQNKSDGLSVMVSLGMSSRL